MLTPLDIHNKVFSKVVRGYKMEEVDAFLDEIIRSHETLFRENRELKDKVGRLEEEIAKNREMSSTLQKTMILAEKVMEEETRQAEKAGELIKQEARQEGARMIQQAKKEALRIHQEIQRLRLYEKQLYLKHKGFLEFQMELLDGYRTEKTEPAMAIGPGTDEDTIGLSEEFFQECQEAAKAVESREEEGGEKKAAALPVWDLEPKTADPADMKPALPDSGAAGPEDSGEPTEGTGGEKATPESAAGSVIQHQAETAGELSLGSEELEQMARKMEEALAALDRIYGLEESGKKE